ncbi:MAG: sulfite exporter TauE/SafE family protein [Burkholderiaceae bacterium]|nr:MAG: sulfite exporter TauE/SafE family protein [Burkholderiaceae bacterium]
MVEFIILAIAAFLAGFVDAVVGGGGLIQLPSLFSVFPNGKPPMLIGTSKFAGIWGTGVAARNYLKSVSLRWALVLPSAVCAFGCAFLGAICLSYFPPTLLRKALPFVLVVIAVYTFWRKDLGVQHERRWSDRAELYLGMLVGAVIGFYDGFFGPGTGSFFVFAFVRIFGYDFLHASAASKLLNVSCNASALLWFGYSGNVMWLLGLWMAACGVVGSIAGSRLAIRHGSGFVRKIFLVVVLALIAKTSYDAFLK